MDGENGGWRRVERRRVETSWGCLNHVGAEDHSSRLLPQSIAPFAQRFDGGASCRNSLVPVSRAALRPSTVATRVERAGFALRLALCATAQSPDARRNDSSSMAGLQPRHPRVLVGVARCGDCHIRLRVDSLGIHLSRGGLLPLPLGGFAEPDCFTSSARSYAPSSTRPEDRKSHRSKRGYNPDA
jgi:hypothetical protein